MRDRRRVAIRLGYRKGSSAHAQRVEGGRDFLRTGIEGQIISGKGIRAEIVGDRKGPCASDGTDSLPCMIALHNIAHFHQFSTGRSDSPKLGNTARRSKSHQPGVGQANRQPCGRDHGNSTGPAQ